MRRWLLPDRLIPLAVGLIPVIAIALWLAFLSPAWLWHPLATQVCVATYHTAAQIRDCKSYNLHSGIEGNIAELAVLATLVGGVIGYWSHHNCHHEGCPRRGHPHPVFGWPACKAHWNEKPEHVTASG